MRGAFSTVRISLVLGAFFMHVGCVSSPKEHASRAPASVLKDLASTCKALLSSGSSRDFDFDLFCKVRDQISEEKKVSLENWRSMQPEELMARLEAASLLAFNETTRLEREKIKSYQARRLKNEILKLQKAKKNQAERVRDLIAFWYELVHEKSALQVFKSDVKQVRDLFTKITAQKRVQRVEAELAKRGATQALESVGFLEPSSFWQKFKAAVYKKRNEKNIVLSALFTVPAVLQADFLFVFLPVWDFAKVENLASRYQDKAYREGHESARAWLEKESRTKGNFSSYFKAVAHVANTTLLGLLILTSVEQYQDTVAAQEEALTMATSADSAEDINREYMLNLADQIIAQQEAELGRPMTAAEKAAVRDQFLKALSKS